LLACHVVSLFGKHGCLASAVAPPSLGEGKAAGTTAHIDGP